ncbi:MAG: transposase [Cyanobacteria bacterium P01_D01_bin.105]
MAIRITYQYKLRPTAAQKAQMSAWLDMLRCQYNWLLGERFDWWEMNRCAVNACPLTCSVAAPKERPNYYQQKRSLTFLKKERPWYKAVQSQVLQEMVRRVDLAFQRFVKGDSNGKRSGRPRFKKQGRYRTFTFPQMKPDCIQRGRIVFPKLGAIKLILHRPMPDGFAIKTAKVTRKADGWYVGLLMECKEVPESAPSVDVAKSVGIDVGLKDFLATSDGDYIAIPQFFRKSERKLAKLQRQLDRQVKGSNRWRKQVNRISKLHLHISRQRKDFFSKVWNWLFTKYDVVAHEKLNIKGLARTRLAKSILDAGWGHFLEMGAFKAGKLTAPQNPNSTSIECSGCGERVPKTLSDQMHKCSCGLVLCRDVNAAKNILNRAVGCQALNLSGNVRAVA